MRVREKLGKREERGILEKSVSHKKFLAIFEFREPHKLIRRGLMCSFDSSTTKNRKFKAVEF